MAVCAVLLATDGFSTGPLPAVIFKTRRKEERDTYLVRCKFSAVNHSLGMARSHEREDTGVRRNTAFLPPKNPRMCSPIQVSKADTYRFQGIQSTKGHQCMEIENSPR